MKAWAYEDGIGLDCLQLVERADPTPGDGETLLRMAAAALNYRNLSIARGAYHTGVSPPLIPVSDGAGFVEAIGAGATRFAVGDLVCPTYMPEWIAGEVTPALARRRLGGPSDGVLRTRMCVSQEAAVRVPAYLSAVEAATLPVAGVTAWHSLHVVGVLKTRDTVAHCSVSAIAPNSARASGFSRMDIGGHSSSEKASTQRHSCQ